MIKDKENRENNQPSCFPSIPSEKQNQGNNQPSCFHSITSENQNQGNNHWIWRELV